MDYNSYLCGVYGARHKNGHQAGYYEIAKEMEVLAMLYANDFQVPPVRDHLTVGGSLIKESGELNGTEVRELALKHLKEIHPTYFTSGRYPLPAPQQKQEG